jgi:hypothetical protein
VFTDRYRLFDWAPDTGLNVTLLFSLFCLSGRFLCRAQYHRIAVRVSSAQLIDISSAYLFCRSSRKPSTTLRTR